MGKKSSVVWKHFETTDGELKCTIIGCRDPILNASATSGTNSQWSHLEHSHPEIYEELKKEKLPSKRKSNGNGTTEKTSKKSKKEDGESQIMMMLARRNVPFTLVDDPLFRMMTTKTFGITSPNKSSHYARTVLPRVATEILSNLREAIGDKHYAITTDGWTALNKPSPSLYR